MFCLSKINLAKFLVVFCFLCSLSVVSPAKDGGYLSAAYLTNAFFTHNLRQDSAGFVQPQRVLNLVSPDPASQKDVFFMAHLLLSDVGSHEIYLDLLDGDGYRIKRIAAETFVVDSDDAPRTIIVNLGEIKLPDASMFVKVFDRHERRERPYMLGKFRVLTALPGGKSAGSERE